VSAAAPGWAGLREPVAPRLRGADALPVCASIYFSFCDYDVLSRPVWVGLLNYQDMVSDRVFWLSVWNTLVFNLIALPLGLVCLAGPGAPPQPAGPDAGDLPRDLLPPVARAGRGGRGGLALDPEREDRAPQPGPDGDRDRPPAAVARRPGLDQALAGAGLPLGLRQHGRHLPGRAPGRAAVAPGGGDDRRRLGLEAARPCHAPRRSRRSSIST
jgi:hypothetical protein